MYAFLIRDLPIAGADTWAASKRVPGGDDDTLQAWCQPHRWLNDADLWVNGPGLHMLAWSCTLFRWYSVEGRLPVHCFSAAQTSCTTGKFALTTRCPKLNGSSIRLKVQLGSFKACARGRRRHIANVVPASPLHACRCQSNPRAQLLYCPDAI